ncbi:MAG: hypothetical protein ABSH06_14285 [Thermodesulfobacteriota bacterium]|jgi:hypothetical protein
MVARTEKFYESSRKLRKEMAETYGHDVNDKGFKDNFDEYEKEALNIRTGKYSKSILKKHPLKSVQQTFDWAKENLSPLEIEEMPFEEIMVLALGSDPQGISSKDMESLYDPKTGQLKPWIPDPYDTDLRWPDTEALQRGEVREVEEKKPSVSTHWISEQEAQKMPLEELGKIISKIKE